MVVSDGPPPGLLALDDEKAVGWCQLTPRDALPALDRTWRLRRVDDSPVWSISCFYIRKGYRRQGVTSVLITAALETARRSGAVAVEAYPIDAEQTPSTIAHGLRIDVRAGRVRDGRSTRVLSPDHALRVRLRPLREPLRVLDISTPLPGCRRSSSVM